MNVRICVPAILLASAAFWAVGRASRAQTPTLPGGKPVTVAPKAFDELQAIDHWNLRYQRDDDDPTLDEQVAQIRRNMDVAAKLGFTSYLLFQEDAFPDLLTWGGKHEPDEGLRRAVREVLDHAKQRRLKLYLHCNEFMWPDRVGVDYGDTDQAWQTYRNALLELIALYPDLAGFEVTADETGGALDTKAGVLKFHNETARALTADARQRTALMRTWQRVDALGSPDTLGDGDEPNVFFSVKNTSEDFRCNSGFDEDLLQVKDPRRLLVEFDAWREYETHNVFPIYLGDYWAPRFEALAEAGVKRVGLRFNWNSGRYPITERPWANWVNVFTFVRLAENPRANPDDILREFVSIYYPPEARDAAFDVYKASFEFVRAIYYCDGEKISDHGRVNRLRKIGGKSVDRDWLKHVDAQLKRMLEKTDALPEQGAYQAELRRGAVAVSSMSKACGLQLGAEGDAAFLTEWKASDPESFEKLRGSNGFAWLEAQEERRPDASAEPVAPLQVDDGDIYEAERAELDGAIVGSKGEDELHEGATGGDYVDFQENSGESIAWVIEMDEAGRYGLAFRYALDDEDPRPLRLTVNGKVMVEAVPFVDTGGWDSWKSVTKEAELQEGRNSIRLESIGDSGPNIDHLRIERLAPAAADAPAPTSVRPSGSQTATRSKTVVGDGVNVELYPVTPIHRSDGKIIGTVQGEPITFESFRTSEQYYYDVSYAWLAADGPVDVALNVDAPVTRGVFRGVLRDIPFRLSDSTFTFTLPGPGHYYLQLPELGQPEPGNRDSGTYTVLLLIDDLQSFRTQQAAMAERDTLDVTTAGIRSDVEEDQTDAIQALVDRGGVIHFPAGIYRVRRLKIPSDTTIHLAAGAVLRSSDGAEVGKSAPFLDLKGSERVRICGPGTIDGNGRPYHLVQTEDSRDVTIEDCLLRNCTSWAIHFLLVDKAVCRNVRVLSGKDGIDPDSARDVQIEDCLIMAKDDGIAVKTRKPPATTERVTVRNCIVASDASALKIGTETRSLIRDVTFENCDVFDSDRGIILYARDGGPIEKVTWRNIHMQMIDWPHEDRGSPFQLVISERDGKTPVRECVVENVKTNCRAPSRFAGLAETPLDGVAFRNIMLQVDPPATDDRPPLLEVGPHVDVTTDGFQIDWQENCDRWSEATSGDGLNIR